MKRPDKYERILFFLESEPYGSELREYVEYLESRLELGVSSVKHAQAGFQEIVSLSRCHGDMLSQNYHGDMLIQHTAKKFQQDMHRTLCSNQMADKL